MIDYPSILPKKWITGKKPNVFLQNFELKFEAKLTNIQSVSQYFAEKRSCRTDLQVLTLKRRDILIFSSES